MRDEVGAEDLHDLPADAGDDGADAQMAGRYLPGREHAEGEHEEPDVGERGQRDRGDAEPRRPRSAPKAPPPVVSPASAVVTSTPAPSTSSKSRLRRRRASGLAARCGARPTPG